MYEETLELIYGAILNPALWPDVLASLVKATDGRGAILSIEDRLGEKIHAFHQHGYDEDSIQRYASEFFAIDEWSAIVFEKDRGSFLSSDIHCYSHKEYINKAFFSEWGKSENIHHATGTYIRPGGDYAIRLGIQRDRTAGEVSSEELEYLNRIRPHLEKALLISGQFSGDGLVTASGLDVFNQLDRGLVIVDANGKIIHANNMAETKICHPDFPVNSSKGVIASPVLGIDTYLKKAIQKAVTGMQLALPKVFLEASSNRPWEFMVTPFVTTTQKLGLPIKTCLALITFKPASLTGNDSAMIQYLCRHFDLSPLEADCVVRLKTGKLPQQIAIDRRVKLSTIRSQIKEVYRKLGVNSQVGLLAKLMRLD